MSDKNPMHDWDVYRSGRRRGGDHRMTSEIFAEWLNLRERSDHANLEMEFQQRARDEKEKLRLLEAVIRDLEYENAQLRGKLSQKPWRWTKTYEVCGERHWCLESIPEPDCGAGDGRKRTVGIILADYWSPEPTEIMLHLLEKINAGTSA